MTSSYSNSHNDENKFVEPSYMLEEKKYSVVLIKNSALLDPLLVHAKNPKFYDLISLRFGDRTKRPKVRKLVEEA
jgi:hypothetical protein